MSARRPPLADGAQTGSVGRAGHLGPGRQVAERPPGAEMAENSETPPNSFSHHVGRGGSLYLSLSAASGCLMPALLLRRRSPRQNRQPTAAGRSHNAYRPSGDRAESVAAGAHFIRNKQLAVTQHRAARAPRRWRRDRTEAAARRHGSRHTGAGQAYPTEICIT